MFAGKIRNYDITKKEWVLRGDTVLYVNAEDLQRTIEYDLEQEKAFSYKGLKIDEVIAHIAKFISCLWQIHPFGEGNTRTTAVFTIKYLRSIGFDVNNDLFAEHSWYFRNALVRANYKNVRKGIEPDMNFLIHFFENLMMNGDNELKNRYMVVAPPLEWKNQQHPTSSSHINSLIQIIADKKLSIKEMLSVIGLKDRENFINNYINPAIKEELIELLYPASPKHPKQKYLLTAKGLSIYNSMEQKH